MIVANPPYVPTPDIRSLSLEVAWFDPPRALEVLARHAIAHTRIVAVVFPGVVARDHLQDAFGRLGISSGELVLRMRAASDGRLLASA